MGVLGKGEGGRVILRRVVATTFKKRPPSKNTHFGTTGTRSKLHLIIGYKLDILLL